MPSNQEQIPWQGRQSGKSSRRWFGGAIHAKGNGASTGDGRTTDASIAGKIIPKFLRGKK
jgi:hypothetical protein